MKTLPAPRTINPLAWVRWCYDLAVLWGEHRWALWILFLVAVLEAIFFPVPPDVLVIAICLARPQRWMWVVLVGAIGSVIGGMAAYALGYWAMDTVGTEILSVLGLTSGFEHVKNLYHQWDFVVVFAAGFTPIPYKLFTLAAGAVGIRFEGFVLASLVSRGLRYGIEGYLLNRYGDRAKVWIDKRFNTLTLILLALLILFIVLQRI